MNYLAGVGGVALFQMGVAYAIILASQGNGSFVGLGVMLMTLLGVPLTALINFSIIHSQRRNPESHQAGRLVYVSLALPVAQLALLVLVSVFRL